MKNLADCIVTIPDFPKPGVLFRDVTGVLGSAESFGLALDELAAKLEGAEFDLVAGVESRGFLFGAPLALRFGKGFVPVRKAGKLPRSVVRATYDLEYGKATIEMHRDAVRPGQRVVIVDDLLATGGTLDAAAALVEELGGTVARIVCLVELAGLGGRARLGGRYEVASCLRFPGA